ncbi:MAG: hypothetical protein LBT33_03080 [Spirochaetia bacterium]|jgi:hypothetical protein|nr:hypothetical protein [Spirochaetia bacterium]
MKIKIIAIGAICVIAASCSVTKTVSVGEGGLTIKIPSAWEQSYDLEDHFLLGKQYLSPTETKVIFSNPGIPQFFLLVLEAKLPEEQANKNLEEEIQKDGGLAQILGNSGKMIRYNHNGIDFFLNEQGHGWNSTMLVALAQHSGFIYVFTINSDDRAVNKIIIDSIKFDSYGLLSGLYDGITWPFCFVLSLFFDFRVYVVANTGFTYWLGFIVGIVLLLMIIGGAVNGSKTKSG